MNPVGSRMRIASQRLPPCVNATSSVNITAVSPVDHSNTGLRPTRSEIGPPAIVPMTPKTRNALVTNPPTPDFGVWWSASMT
jgi:hypothetical protein